MKIKCPRHKAAGCTEDHSCFVEIEIPTADLIAELEKRKPCGKCDYPVDMGKACLFSRCRWWQIGGEDNFKPSGK